MSRELLQQALDALQTNNAWLDYAAPQYVLDRNNQAIAALEQKLAKQEFYPDWDMLKPFHERIAELEAQLAKPEQASNEPPDYVEPPTSDYHNGWEEGFEAAKNLFKGKNT
jgi:uncharacterized coiled-coil protein SlyX